MVLDDIRKLEVVIEHEITVYGEILNYEHKKVAVILNNKLQDMDLLCNYQTSLMGKARELAAMKAKIVESIAAERFPHLLGKVSVSDVINRIPIANTVTLAAKRLELNALIYRLRGMNKVLPRLLEQGLSIFRNTRDMLRKSKKIGYNNKGVEEVFRGRLTSLVSRHA
ncbi:MAG: flagellar export chaperone FlgN [Spirochaetota bacterium]